jgi:hypothetical protein
VSGTWYSARGAELISSSDGMTWTAASLFPADFNAQSVCLLSGALVVVGTDSVGYSFDGATWTFPTSPTIMSLVADDGVTTSDRFIANDGIDITTGTLRVVSKGDSGDWATTVESQGLHVRGLDNGSRVELESGNPYATGDYNLRVVARDYTDPPEVECYSQFYSHVGEMFNVSSLANASGTHSLTVHVGSTGTVTFDYGVSVTGTVRFANVLNLGSYENLDPQDGDLWRSGSDLLYRDGTTTVRLVTGSYP